MVWSLKKYFLFCDDKFFLFLVKLYIIFSLANIMETLGDKKKQKSSTKYSCNICDYNTCRKSNIDKHFLTDKHKNMLVGDDGDKKEQISSKKKQICDDKNICENCNKQYNSRNGLWKHKKTCKTEDNTNLVVKENTTDKDQLILMLIKQNSALIKETTDFKSMMVEQQNMMMEVIKNGTHNTTNTITNSNNKAFNLNLFLNETCKDAMNINDFVESIKLQVSDLENVGEVGFVEGISNIIVKNLNALDVTKRPIHCTDKKREIIYIKDENVWEKDESQCKMRKMIKKVVSKNQRLIPKFKEQYPDYNKYHSKTSDKYNKLIIESMGGSGDNDAEKEDKIVRNIVKNVVVDKCL